VRQVIKQPLFCTLACPLADAAGDPFYAVGDFAAAAVLDQQMHVVGGGDVVEQAQAEALPGLRQPVSSASVVARELKQQIPATTIITSLREMPDLARDE